jgi:hypothetical protein
MRGEGIWAQYRKTVASTLLPRATRFSTTLPLKSAWPRPDSFGGWSTQMRARLFCKRVPGPPRRALAPRSGRHVFRPPIVLLHAAPRGDKSADN